MLVDKIRCDTCPIYRALVDLGKQDYFDRNCRPESCQLNRRKRLAHAELWEWFHRLIQYSNEGFDGLVCEWFKPRPLWYLDAYIEYRSAYNAAVDKARAKAHEQGG